MPAEHLTYEYQSDALPVGFGGKERTEEFRLYLLADTRTIVYNFDKCLCCRSDNNLSIASYAFHRVLQNIDQYLFHQTDVGLDVLGGIAIVKKRFKTLHLSVFKRTLSVNKVNVAAADGSNAARTGFELSQQTLGTKCRKSPRTGNPDDD